MSDIVAYRAKNISALEQYLNARKKQIESFNENCKEFKKKYNVDNLTGIQMYAGGWVIEGYVKKKYNEAVPVGWRLAKVRGSWEVVPAKRTPEGKEIAEELRTKLYLPNVKYPGFPEMLFAKNHSVFPRLRKYSDTEYFIVLSMPADDSGVDQAIWEKTSLADFYAATENKEFEEL